MEAIGINYADCVTRMGLYASAKHYVGFPITPGFEVAGRVAAVGPGVTDLPAGAEVMALAASVFFLFYQFWGYCTTPVQVSLLISAPLLTLLLIGWVSRREATAYFAKLLSMVSFACFVLNLVMLGQIFNITPSDKALLVRASYRPTLV